MAKKDKKGEGVVQNREIFQRMNFLYQAAMYMATITTPHAPTLVDDQDCNVSSLVASETVPGTKQDTTSSQFDLSKEHKDVEMGVEHIRPKGPLPTTNPTTPQQQQQRPSKKLSRRKRKILQREFKNKVAMEQISTDKAHHSLTQHTKHHNLHQLSGTARFYASTLREIGRKNVIRIDPIVKRSICLRCEAVLLPSISCEVRIEATPQLHTLVTCIACGAFRRYFCMPGRGTEDDRWEPESQTTTDSMSTEVSVAEEEERAQGTRAMDDSAAIDTAPA